MNLMWESPYPLAAIGLCLIATAAAAWQNGRRKPAAGLLLAGAMAIPGGWILDGAVETDAEQITASVEALVADYKASNAAAVKDAMSRDAVALRALVEPAMAAATFEDERLTDVSVSTDGDTAAATFRLNADFRLLKSAGGGVRQPTRWKLAYVREGGDWKVSDVTELDPFSGEVRDRWRRYVH